MQTSEQRASVVEPSQASSHQPPKGVEGVAGMLAAMALADNLRDGNTIEIPCLGISITTADLSNGTSND